MNDSILFFVKYWIPSAYLKTYYHNWAFSDWINYFGPQQLRYAEKMGLLKFLNQPKEIEKRNNFSASFKLI